jgi:hypothetical protein
MCSLQPQANVHEGVMWPRAFALKESTAADEARDYRALSV